MAMKKITQEQFSEIYKNLGVTSLLNEEDVFDAFCFAYESASSLAESKIFGKAVPVNPVVLLLYLINEYAFYLDCHHLSCKEVAENDDIVSQIISISLDKYFTNEHLNFKNQSYISKYSPSITTLEVYLNFVLGVLKKFPSKNPKETLLLDFIYKGFSISKAIADLIIDGFETEAFSTWRTLHETECILSLLSKNRTTTIPSYLKHIKYALAYRKTIPSDEADKIFIDIKKEMAELNLKSKDMKKFIEYGWLSSIPNYNADPDFKFNFRDGVERLAGLHNYSMTYEMASEIAHSSPLLIYSKSEYYLHLSLLLLYESFFRLEKIFTENYIKRISEEEINRYKALRNLYYNGLIVLYKKEKESFELFNTKKAS